MPVPVSVARTTHIKHVSMNSLSPPAPSLLGWNTVWALVVAGIELGIVAALAVSLWGLAAWLLRRAAAFRGRADDWISTLQSRVRIVLTAAVVAMAAGVLGYDG